VHSERCDQARHYVTRPDRGDVDIGVQRLTRLGLPAHVGGHPPEDSSDDCSENREEDAEEPSKHRFLPKGTVRAASRTGQRTQGATRIEFLSKGGKKKNEQVR
jgi:hypothetical protein